MPRHKPRFDDDEPRSRGEGDPRSARTTVEYDFSDDVVPDCADRWSSWDLSTAGERGPKPYPDWLVIELAPSTSSSGC